MGEILGTNEKPDWQEIQMSLANPIGVSRLAGISTLQQGVSMHWGKPQHDFCPFDGHPGLPKTECA